MADWLASPHLIDAILAFTVFETAALGLWHRLTGRGLSGLRLLATALPGMCLMVALRAALSGAPLPFVPVALAAALVCHLAELGSR